MTKTKKTSKKKQREREKLKILAAGDLHGDVDAARKLSKKAKKEKVDLVLLLGDIHGIQESKGLMAEFKKNKQRLVFVPGNWDTSFETGILEDIYNLKNLERHYVTYGDVGIFGVGNSDFRFSVDKKELDRLMSEFRKAKARKKILVSHLHSKGSKAEFSGFPGDEIIRKAIDYLKPDLFLSAHIHEAEGIEEKIGKTKVIQVGRKGKIFEI